MTMDATAASGEMRSFGGWSAFCAAARAVAESGSEQSDRQRIESEGRKSDADCRRK